MTRWLIGMGLAAALAAAPASAKTVIKFASLAPQGSSYHDILLDLQGDWAEISGGAVELRIYADGVAGDESDVVRKLRVDQLQAAIVTSGGLPDIHPDFRAFQVPMMFEDIAEFDHILREMRPALDRMLAGNGFRGLGWADAGWLHFFSRRPVRTPDDLRPQRIFVWSGADRFVEAWRDCGFRPVQLDYTGVHTALQSGMIDVITPPPLAALSSQWFAQIPNMSTLNWVPMMAGFVITERAWQMLPEDLRPALVAAVERAADRTRTKIRADSETAVRVMREHGLTVHALSGEEIAAWRGEVRRCFDPLIGGYIDGAVVRQIEDKLRAFRASH